MIYLLLLVPLGLLFLNLFLLLSMLREVWLSWKGADWQQRQKLEKSVEAEFPIGAERIFTGQYISHWEIGGFHWNQGFTCQLEVPPVGGWDWLITALGNPTAREEYAGKFDFSFRGKLLEQGNFGHMGMCTYRIEVIEILIATHLT